MELEQTLTSIPNESVSVRMDQFSNEVVSPEWLVQIVRNEEIIS
jgi:hypothetical protein